MSSSSKFATDKNQRVLIELVNQPGNDVCADCKARAPRWASHNLGIFICVNCASIHRKIGTHITKVKSVTLDTWTKEQVENMKKVGNINANAYYNPDEKRHPPPTNFIETERDSELEKYIRAKYEFKSFRKRAPTAYDALPDGRPGVSSMTPSSSIDRSAAVAALLGPSRSAASRMASSSTQRSVTLPPTPTTPSVPASASKPAAAPPSAPQPPTPAMQDLSRQSMRSVSLSNAPPQQSQPQSQPAPAAGVWGDLQSLQSRTIDATLPLQVVASPTHTQPMGIPSASASYLGAPNPFSNLSSSAGNPFPASYNQTTGSSPGAMGQSMSLGSGLSVGLGTSYTGASNLSPFPPSPFQPSPINASGAPMTPASSTPSPNPFAQQSFQTQPGTFGQQSMMGVPSQPGTPFGAPSFGQPQMYQAQTQMQSQMQPQMQVQMQPQMQYAQPQANSYMQNQSPYMGAHMGSTPSPFGASQSMPQMQQPMQQQQQQPQQGFGGTNPFTSWVQQPPQPQGGYQQQQWGM